MSIAAWSGALLSWAQELSDLKRRLAPVFRRRELQETGGAFLDGLLSGIERKTGWLMAEQAGADRPYRMQSLLGRSHWDAERLRDEVRAYVVEALGDPEGVLIVDETGFLKKGKHSVGVARQYSGTAGRIENCQVGVFLSYASRFGHALIDRQLYLPEGWAGDDARRSKAAVPTNMAFATKPEIARDRIAAALDAGVPCAFVLGDALYGSDTKLRRMLQARRQPYVLAVRSNHYLRISCGRPERWEATGPERLADELGSQAWHCHAAGEGAKGPRLYDWARVKLPWSRDPDWEHWLLVRRRRSKAHERAYYLCWAKTGTTLAELAGVAGLRWTIATCFATAKDELGLDHCEARSWHGWHRHMSLVMTALAFLAKLRADLLRASWQMTPPSKRNERSPAAPAIAA